MQVSNCRSFWPTRFVCLAIFSCCTCLGQTTPAEKAPAPDPPASPTNESKNFFARWREYYRQDWAPAAAADTSPEPTRRGLPAPLESPPFPDEDWTYGGSPAIGLPDSNSYPLMTALKHPNSRTKIYGWINPTLNFSTSDHENWPEANDEFADRFELNELTVYVERLPDSVQTDHIDWGYHLTALYGTDYRFTMGKGYFSSQWLDDHHQYGFDPALEYFDLYVPYWFKGMNFRVGRFLTLPGIEGEQTPSNYLSSVSLAYLVSPTSDTGIVATAKLSDQLVVQLGINAGHDVALWTPDAKPSVTACVSYTTHAVTDNIYACANGINDGKYAYDNMQQYDTTWYHKFSKTFTMETEAVYMYQRQVPAVAGPVAPQPNTFAAHCLPGAQTCTAPEYAVLNLIEKGLSATNYVTLRNEFLNDKKGQGTGYSTKYTEHTFGFCHWIGSTIQIRPEIRFERAWDAKAYNTGQQHNSITVASDIIFHF